MRRTAPMLLAVFAPSVAHAASCAAPDAATLVACLLTVNDGDSILLTAGQNYKNLTGFIVDDSITIQQSPLGGTDPLIMSTGTGGGARPSLVVNAGKTLTLLDVKLDNAAAVGDNRPIIDVFGSLIGDDLQFEAQEAQSLAAGIEVRANGKLTLTDTLFNGAMKNSGGGAAIQALTGTTLSLTNVTASKASSSTGRGGFLSAGSGSTIAIANSTFSNWSALRGGAFYANTPTSFAVTGSTFTANKAWSTDSAVVTDDGGCIAVDDGSISVSGSKFKDCDAGDDGGAIAVFGGSVTLIDTILDSNHASSDGGGLYVERGALDADKVTSTGNDALANGGSIALRGGTVVRAATIDASSFSTDKAADGGAIFTEAATLAVGTSTFLTTKATNGDGGGILALGSDLTVTSCMFDATEADGDGGGIFANNATVGSTDTASDLVLLSSTFDGSTATGDGGGVFIDDGAVDVDSTVFVSCMADGDGGGMYVKDTLGTPTIDKCSFTTGGADSGGGVVADNADLTMASNEFDRNTAIVSGGGLYVTGTATIASTADDFLGNKATINGGGIYVGGSSNLLGVGDNFVSNEAGLVGGAIYGHFNTSLTIDGGTLDTNKADQGGAIRANAATLTVRNGASFTGNVATAGDGGAISSYVFVDGNGNYTSLDHTTSIADSSFASNKASDAGGAVAMHGWGSFTVARTDFIGNTAATTGGAVWMRPDDDGKNAGAYSVTSSIFTGNLATTGGALYANATDTGQDNFTFTDDMFSSNVADNGGGVWVDQTSVIDIGRNTLCDNWADNGNGGGVYVGTSIGTGTTRNIHNNFFVENKSKNKGGALHLGDPDVPVVNNLFLTNTSDTLTEAGSLWIETDTATIRNNLVLGTTKGDGVRIPTASTVEQYNGFASNTAAHRTVGGTASAPVSPSFVFTTAPDFFAYTTGTPADSKGCDVEDFRVWMWPDVLGTPYPVPGIQDAGSAAVPSYTDKDGTKNDIGPFGGAGASLDWWTDHDGDGALWVYDCNDTDPNVAPGKVETCNGVDDDCDKLIDDSATVGMWFEDVDKDGYGDDTKSVAQCSAPVGYVNKGGDCNDAAGTVNPGAVEKCSSVGVDDDCDTFKDESDAIDAGTWYADVDVDTYGDITKSSKACVQPVGSTDLTKATDCDDATKSTNPGASEICNTVDDDCDKQVDESATDATSWYPDVDQDKQGDATATVTKACTAPPGSVSQNTDCDDKTATTFLGATETCNDVDDDCDGIKDDGLTTYPWFSDGDGDAYGSGTGTVDCGAPGAGWTKQSGDCNDANAAINPAASDSTCNNVDDDCDTLVDDNATFQNWYEDKDGDKYGTSVTKNACAQPTGYTSATGDCDDLVPTTYPNAVETCNLVDDDCDGTKDDNVVTYTFYEDKDGDGYGGTATKTDCKAPAGYVLAKGDCDDTTAAISPGAAEKCNDGIDQNCDGDDDKGAVDATAWYADTDKDGQGAATSVVLSCDPVAGRVATGKDCDDADSTILDGLNWYGDGDSDGYGDLTDLAYQCVAPPGYLKDASDCNDVDSAIHPNAAERCVTAGIDDDCDKLPDDLDPQGVADGTTFYVDADNDTYGDVDATTVTGGIRSACLRPSGYSGNALDCDDAKSNTRPGAPEQCDTIDNDCDGAIDENVTYEVWWADDDGDGFGDANAATVIDCIAPIGHVGNDIDCDDKLAGVNPNAPEQCNGIDDDCDGEFDESDAIDQIAYYLDEDGDNWAIPDDEILACEQPPNHSTQLGDCDDVDINVNPAATETCDGEDNDCDGRIDEGLGSQTVYVDLDGDGFGDDATAAVVCRAPGVDESDVGGDCDDGDDTINPDATEVWYDGVDSDCQGDDDDDQDGDGVPAGDLPSEDCDDLAAGSYPGAVDVPGDGIDQDCDGADDVDLPEDDRPLDTDLVDTGVAGVRGDACGCGTSGAPSLSLAALVAAFAGWRRARKIMPGHANGGRPTLPHPRNAR